MLYRENLSDLVNWYRRDQRKPLLIRGARQVGKTTLVRLLAQRLNIQLVEINLEKPWRFIDTFSDLNPSRTIEAIEFELNIDIDPQVALLFFDEVQACPAVLPLLRYFYEEAPSYRVVATGSLLEFILAEPKFSIPVGRIELFHLGPMTFREFLRAVEEEKIATRLESYRLGEALPLYVHQKLNQLVRLYSIVGGMPEAVAGFAHSRSFKETEKLKSEIIATFRMDFNKYVGKSKPQLLTRVFDSMPRLVGKKLTYSHIDPSMRSPDLALAINQLCMAGIIAKIFKSNANGVPLAAEINERFFKIMLLDTGLLLTQLRLLPTEIDRVEELNLVNRGALAEQFIGQHLFRLLPVYQEPELYYWAREKRASAAEVDFVISDEANQVVPIEVKAGSSGSLRSLQVMVWEKSLTRAVRFCSAPPSLLREKRQMAKGVVDFELISLPHYLVQELTRLLAQ